jgi:hypothetical protein
MIDLHELEELRKQNLRLNYWRACLDYWMSRANSGNTIMAQRANYYAMLIDDYMQIPF